MRHDPPTERSRDMTVRLYTRNEEAKSALVDQGFILRDDSNRPGWPYVEITKGEPTPDVLAGIDIHLVGLEYELSARFQRRLQPAREESVEFQPNQWIAVRAVKKGWNEFGEDPDTYEFTVRTTSVDAMHRAYALAYQHR